MVKWYISSQKTHLKATERHLPYGITQLAPNSNSAKQARTQFIYSEGVEGHTQLDNK